MSVSLLDLNTPYYVLILSLQCTLGTRGGPVAKFRLADDNVSFIRDYVDCLEVQPAGHRQELFDEIVLSALLVQRQRMLLDVETIRRVGY